MRRALLQVPPYAWLLASIPPLRVFASNTDRLAVSWFLTTLAVTFGIYFAGRAIFKRAVKVPEIAELLWAILYLGILESGYFFPEANRELVTILSCLAASMAVIFGVSLRRLISALLVIFAGVGAAIPLIIILGSPVWFDRPAIRRLAAAAFGGDLPQPARGGSPEKRDIYYLIFDRYARADQLRKVYGFDNEPFIRQLESRGFAVAEGSFANYQRTTHSLISSLNLDYLQHLDRPPASSSHDWLPLYEMLHDFRLRRFLDAQGYEFHFFGSWWEPTRVNRFADKNYNWHAIPEPFRVLIDQSLIPSFAHVAGIDLLDHRLAQCQRSKRAFVELGKLVEARTGPRFIFAHLLVPHPPFVLDQDGNCISAKEAQARSRAQNYVAQVVYTNREILKFVDLALRQPGLRPIIIIQSDEGPWPQRFAGDEITRLGADVTPADWSAATPDELVEKMAILNAMYLPDRDISGITESATPVNSFRVVLSEYFGVQLDPLPDRQIIFESAQRLYRFHDVTETLKQAEEEHP